VGWAVAGLVVLSAGGAALVARDSGDAGRVGEIQVNMSEAFPSSELRDWASFSDGYVVVRVTGEERYDDRGPEARAVDEGAIGRRVTMQVLEVLWARPDGEPIPRTLTFDGFGWVRSKGRDLRMKAEAAGDLNTGETYAFPVIYLPETGVWGPLSITTVVPVGADGLLRPGNLGAGAEVGFPGLSAITGKTPADAAGILRSTRPYPGLQGLRGLERIARGRGLDLGVIRENNGLPAQP